MIDELEAPALIGSDRWSQYLGHGFLSKAKRSADQSADQLIDQLIFPCYVGSLRIFVGGASYKLRSIDE